MLNAYSVATFRPFQRPDGPPYVLIVCPVEFDAGSPVRPTSELEWVQPGPPAAPPRHGRGPVALLPRGDDVVLVLPPMAVSWHAVALPRMPANRVRAALDGLLEDRLLDEVEHLHLALEPGGKPGQSLWVAACRREPLKAWLALLQDAGHRVVRIAPALWPQADGGAALHHAFDWQGEPWLARQDDQGVTCLPLAAMAGVAPAPAGTAARWTADPSVASVAEAQLQRPVSVLTGAQWLQSCADGPWNLAQFGLSLSQGARQGQKLGQWWQQFRSAPAWRPARWGLGALLVVQLLGLNLMAQAERRSQAAQRAAIDRVLQEQFPSVTLVLDAPVQMQREVERLQRSAGLLDRNDLESLLAALGGQLAGDGSLPTPDRVRFADGQLRLEGWRVEAARLQALQDGLSQAGWQLRTDSEGLVLTASPATGGRP